MTKSRMLVTGANGFVGRALCDALVSAGHPLRRATRIAVPEETARSTGLTETMALGSFGSNTDWSQALEGVACVIHLAARAHVMQEHSRDALAEYRIANVSSTEKLARDAATQGVRRLVFLSSIKVNGERTSDRPFTEDALPQPEDAYGISKLEAEQLLWKIAADTGLEVVVLRAPLVYGAGVKGNFLRLMNIVRRGMPLPLASIQNLRSLIYLGNLVDAITACVTAPAAAGKTYLLSDGQDISTPELLRSIAGSMYVSSRSFRCPLPLLKTAAIALGKRAEFRRLTESLRIDSSKIQRELGWIPSHTLTQGLSDTAQWYYSQFLRNSST